MSDKVKKDISNNNGLTNNLDNESSDSKVKITAEQEIKEIKGNTPSSDDTSNEYSTDSNTNEEYYEENEEERDEGSHEEGNEEEGNEDKYKENDNKDNKEKEEGNNDESDKSIDEDIVNRDNTTGNQDENRRVKQPNRQNSTNNQDNGSSNEGSDPEKSNAQKIAEATKNKLKGSEASKDDKSPASVKNIAKTGKMAIGVAVKVLLNPITWVVIGSIILLTWIMSVTSILGRNDYNEACDFTGTGIVQVSNDADDFTRKSAITSWLTSTPFVYADNKPMTKEMAFGVMGNFIQESSNANHHTVQNESLDYYKTCDNKCVLSIPLADSKGFGLAQWDRTRRVALVNFADSEGTQWYDLNTQLKFLKVELDGSKGSALKRNNFFDTTKTVKDYTEIWEEIFEVSADDAAMIARRVTYSEEWASQYTGGGGTTGSCYGGSIDTSNLVQLAIQVSYSREEKGKGLGYGTCSTISGCGQTFAKPEYIDAKKLAEDSTGADPAPGALASCDRFVATMMRLTGTDEAFPWGGVSVQVQYMSRPNSGWEQVSCPNRMPGDVLTRDGHVMLYIGEHEGRDSIASASIALEGRLDPGERGRTAMIGEVSCSGNSFSADGASNNIGWRRVGN